ncbi:MAG: ATP-binding protein [Minisyncoccia bacterium]
MKEPLTEEKLKEILKSKQIEQLIGYAENHFFDAKRDFYNLLDPKDKHEICKDISAFANNNGGYLLIGCDTNKPEASRIEYIKNTEGISDFPDMDRVHSTLSDYIFPNSINTLVNFEQIISYNNKKFFLITIVKDSEEKPYFVKKDVQDREFFAFYIRTNDRGIRQDIGHIHELVQRGIYFEKHLKNITGVVEKTFNNTEKILGKTQGLVKLRMRYDIKKDL